MTREAPVVPEEGEPEDVDEIAEEAEAADADEAEGDDKAEGDAEADDEPKPTRRTVVPALRYNGPLIFIDRRAWPPRTARGGLERRTTFRSASN